MPTNCFRFAPRDSVPGLIAKICKYLKDHPGWSEEELEEQIKQLIGQTGVESFNGRTGSVVLNEDDVNNLKIASAYFAEGDETIDELDLVSLYNQGVRFVFTNWNSVTSGYDLTFVLDYFSGSNDVVYYPMATGSGGGGNIVSVNGKTGVVELSLADILGDSDAQVKLCTATEFASATIGTWNAYYNDGYRVVGVVNSNATAVDYLYILKQGINNHQPIMVLGGSVLSVNNQSGDVILDVVDVSENDSVNEFAKLFINENEEYPITPAIDSDALGGKPPSYYATNESVNKLKQQKASKAGWTANKIIGTDANGNLVAQDPPESGADPLTIYPVGSIYMSVNETSPASLFGGTWEQLKDRFLLGAGDNYAAGVTGGEARHAITVPEMPPHNHYINGNAPGTAAAGTDYLNIGGVSADNTNWGANTSFVGGGQPMNIMPPYLAVYMWRRIS